MENQAYTLRTIAKSAGVPPLADVARQPGVQSALRVTCYYFDGSSKHSVATLRQSRAEGIRLEVIFLGALAHRPLVYPVAPSRYQAFLNVLAALHFDSLPDQPGIPSFGQHLWMVERAAGGFIKGVILAPLLAPALAGGAYPRVMDAVREYLPAAVRVIREQG